MLFSGSSDPLYTFSTPRPIFFANIPTIRISSVGGIAVSANPSGHRDVILPGITSNPVNVEFETVGVPLGTLIELKVAPDFQDAQTLTSSAVTGSTTLGSANVDVDFENGNSVLTAQATFTINASNSGSSTSSFETPDYSRYAQGQPVEKIMVSLDEQGRSVTTFITFSGESFSWPSRMTAIN